MKKIKDKHGKVIAEWWNTNDYWKWFEALPLKDKDKIIGNLVTLNIPRITGVRFYKSKHKQP
jgi:hypothetical protein